MKYKLIALTALLITSTTSFAMNQIAAGELGISNPTFNKFSFKANDICSKEIGVVEEATIKTISLSQLNSCFEKNVCEIQVYDQFNCEGRLIGGVKIYNSGNSMDVYSEQTDILLGASIQAHEYNIFLEETNPVFKHNTLKKK